jgi:hypothetical protein
MDTLDPSSKQTVVNSETAYRQLQQIIGFQYDRYTGMQTSMLPLLAQPLNHNLYPNCQLIVIMQEDRTWSALLTLAFRVGGRMSFPPPGETVNWLIDNQRATSFVIDSNGYTVSRNFRVGTDVMPGPLFLWVSAPITIARTSGWISILLTDQILQMLYRADFADFRVAGMEFRLTGHNHANQGKPHPLAHYISGLRGFIEQRPNSPETKPLIEIVNKMEKARQRSRFVNRVVWSMVGLFVLLLFGSCLYLVSQQPERTKSNSIIAPSPSPSPSGTPSAKKERQRKK